MGIVGACLPSLRPLICRVCRLCAPSRPRSWPDHGFDQLVENNGGPHDPFGNSIQVSSGGGQGCTRRTSWDDGLSDIELEPRHIRVKTEVILKIGYKEALF